MKLERIAESFFEAVLVTNILVATTQLIVRNEINIQAKHLYYHLSGKRHERVKGNFGLSDYRTSQY